MSVHNKGLVEKESRLEVRDWWGWGREILARAMGKRLSEGAIWRLLEGDLNKGQEQAMQNRTSQPERHRTKVIETRLIYLKGNMRISQGAGHVGPGKPLQGFRSYPCWLEPRGTENRTVESSTPFWRVTLTLMCRTDRADWEGLDCFSLCLSCIFYRSSKDLFRVFKYFSPKEMGLGLFWCPIKDSWALKQLLQKLL